MAKNGLRNGPEKLLDCSRTTRLRGRVDVTCAWQDRVQLRLDRVDGPIDARAQAIVTILQTDRIGIRTFRQHNFSNRQLLAQEQRQSPPLGLLSRFVPASGC